MYNCIIQSEDGRRSGFEVKLNPDDMDEAAVKMLKITSLFKHNLPDSQSVVVGKSGIAYRRPDGVYVLPITTLTP